MLSLRLPGHSKRIRLKTVKLVIHCSKILRIIYMLRSQKQKKMLQNSYGIMHNISKRRRKHMGLIQESLPVLFMPIRLTMSIMRIYSETGLDSMAFLIPL